MYTTLYLYRNLTMPVINLLIIHPFIKIFQSVVDMDVIKSVSLVD